MIVFEASNPLSDSAPITLSNEIELFLAMDAIYSHYVPVSKKERKSLYECYKKLVAIPHIKHTKILRMLRITEQELGGLIAEIESKDRTFTFYE